MRFRCAVCHRPVPAPGIFPSKSGLLGNHVFLAPQDGSPVTVFSAYCDSHLAGAEALYPKISVPGAIPSSAETELYFSGRDFKKRHPEKRARRLESLLALNNISISGRKIRLEEVLQLEGTEADDDRLVFEALEAVTDNFNAVRFFSCWCVMQVYSRLSRHFAIEEFPVCWAVNTAQNYALGRADFTQLCSVCNQTAKSYVAVKDPLMKEFAWAVNSITLENGSRVVPAAASALSSPEFVDAFHAGTGEVLDIDYRPELLKLCRLEGKYAGFRPGSATA